MERALAGIHLACRLADRALAPIEGAQALADRLGARTIGSGAQPSETSWADDLRAARGCLLEAGGQISDALAAGERPLLLAGDCSIGLTTLAACLRERPEVKVLWLDAHGDFNTPDTTESGYLGGMALAGAVGEWDPGLGVDPIDPEQAVLVGVRALDRQERELLEASEVTVVGASLETLVFTQNALDGAPVFVHLDLDVLDPEDLPAWSPAPGGLRPDKLYDLLEAVADECEIVGVEITGADPAPRSLDISLRVVEPLLAS